MIKPKRWKNWRTELDPDFEFYGQWTHKDCLALFDEYRLLAHIEWLEQRLAEKERKQENS